MTRTRKLVTIAAVLLVMMALIPVATASPGAPLRMSGTATLVRLGLWDYDFDGDLTCSGHADVPYFRVVGNDLPFDGTMHWSEIMELDCDDGTMTLHNYGTWTFENNKFRVNGTVVAATGTLEHLIGASTHQQGQVTSFGPPLSGPVSIRIN
jgi:hypothetical protein